MSEQIQTVTLSLTVEEANVVLASLAKQPFEVVSVVIAKIHEQAKEQLSKEATEE